MLGVTAAGAATTVLLFVLYATSSPDGGEAPPDEAPVVSFVPLPGGGFVGLSGLF
jgi:hypothetical protein